MGTTTRLTLPYPELTNSPDGPDQIGDLARALDTITAIFDTGPLASRPVSTPGSPGNEGRFYYATDEAILYFDHGTGWLAVNPELVLPEDGPAGTPSLRTLGTGAQQAAAGNDARLTDQRVPTDGSVTATKVAAALKPSQGAGNATEALRAIGTAAGQVLSGAAGAVGTTNLADNAITQVKIADAAVGSAEIVDASVRAEELAAVPLGLKGTPSSTTTTSSTVFQITITGAASMSGGMTQRTAPAWDFIVPFSGWYRVLVTYAFAPASAGRRAAQILFKNPADAGYTVLSTMIMPSVGADQFTFLQCTWVGTLSSGAYVESNMWQDSGASISHTATMAVEYLSRV